MTDTRHRPAGPAPGTGGPADHPPAGGVPDPREPAARLLRDLRSGPAGLSGRDAARRLARFGPNTPARAEARSTWRALRRQLTHPLAVLLLVAAVLAVAAGTAQLGTAILVVVVLNAGFAFLQERHAGRAVEALGRYLPPHARVRRDATVRSVPAAELVPGDVLLLAEGDRVPADARLLSGGLQIDASALTGESVPVVRDASAPDTAARALDSPVLLFSGTGCVAGAAEAVVHATGAHTEIGRIAALAGTRPTDESPLERQVRRVARLIAAVAVGVGVAFVPLGVVAGLSLTEALVLAVGLIVANVPEGLLPTITLALAVGVRAMADRGALVKRLSAVETLGSTTVICTDKTGTLTTGTMRVVDVRGPGPETSPPGPAFWTALARCSTADPRTGAGDPTELALLEGAAAAGAGVDAGVRDAERLVLHAFDPHRMLMSTLDPGPDGPVLHVKGAPGAVLARCVLPADRRAAVEDAVAAMAGRGLRVLAVARRDPAADPAAAHPAAADPGARDAAESGLTLLGLVGLLDPPRPEAPAAVASCHHAGIRVHVVSGDDGRTAAEIARRVGIGADRVVDGAVLDAMTEPELERFFAGCGEVVVARAAPEAKLRIADALRARGEVVAMTGDGVNDAPALRHADIGVAMGRSGTEVAREAATLVLTDDDVATVVAGVEEGRRVYDNVRKFVVYIFGHLLPELVPFLAFALSGGLIPLPIGVLQILAIDLGTDLLPALALSREPAEPGLMDRPPRPRSENVITGEMLLRAWGLMGPVAAVLATGLFLAVLVRGGWSPGAATGPGSPLHTTYRQATTATFAAIVACQVGTAFAARTRRVSLRSVGITTNRLLLGALAAELVFAAAAIFLPVANSLLGTTPPPAWVFACLLPMPLLVWGTDEAYRGVRRAREPARLHPAPPGAGR
ncbi:cation-transporting P-type ATPase [Pseudonocardia alni]|uniref:cation-translocating P-type ATPase n=1 Tax=Pseudonocardia alni TaxID=33907 RepID=UPI0033E2EB0E